MALRRAAATAFRCRFATYGSIGRVIASNARLRLFLCAPDAQSDRAGAALLHSLKRLYKGQLVVDGIGGPLLQAAGLLPVVDSAKYTQCVLTEQVGRLSFVPGVKHHKDLDVDAPTIVAQAKLLPELVTAVLDGYMPPRELQQQPPSQPSPPEQHQQQQSQSPGKESASTSSDSSSIRLASSNHGIPQPPKLQQSQGEQQQQEQAGNPGTIKQQQRELVGGPAYDVVVVMGGQRLNQQLLGSLRVAQRKVGAALPPVIAYKVPRLWDTLTYQRTLQTWAKACDHVMCTLPFEAALFSSSDCPTSFVGHPIIQELLVQQQQQRQEQVAQQKGVTLRPWFAGGESLEGVFLRGDAAGFRRQHAQQLWPELCKREGDSRLECSSSSSGTPADLGSEGAAADGPLILLLPGRQEKEMMECMAAFDVITRGLVGRTPNLAAAMVVPTLWVPAAREAVANFSLPVVVLDEQEEHQVAAAVSAAKAALSHAGEISLLCVAGGLPLVPMRVLHPLQHGLAYWKSRNQLPCAAVVNLIAGRKVVEEVVVWGRHGLGEAEQALARLLADPDARAEQAARLQSVLTALLPPSPHGCHSAALLPSDEAARTLLQLLQQQAGGRISTQASAPQAPKPAF